jgi:hypothetical protein
MYEVPAKGFIEFLHHSQIEGGIPSFTNANWWDEQCKQYEVINIDNLYSIEGDRVNTNIDAFNEFVLKRKREGKTLIIWHHSTDRNPRRQMGKQAKEFHMDTVIELRKCSDARPDDPARFQILYRKHRRFYGKDALPIPLVEMLDDTWVFKDPVTVIAEAQEAELQETKDKIVEALRDDGDLTTTQIHLQVFDGHKRGHELAKALGELMTAGTIIATPTKRGGGKVYALVAKSANSAKCLHENV